MIVIGVDVHKQSVTAVAVDEAGRMLDEKTISVGSDELVGWAAALAGERERPHSRQLPSSYQVTLGGLGSAAATQRWQVSPRATCGNRVSRRRPSLCRAPDATRRE